MGKTTLAAALAVELARAPGRRVLVASTDPAHSLADALLPDAPSGALSGEPRPVPLPEAGPGPDRTGELLAVELAAGAAWERWLARRRVALETLAGRGTYLEGADIARLLDLPLPGVDELVGLLELVRLAREAGCTRVMVDTAPTAHTLRLLRMPEALGRFAAVLGALQARHRAVVEALAGAYREDEADAAAAEVEAEARELAELVRDPARTAFTWVLLPEALSLAESRDALAALEEAGAPVDEVVVNRLTPAPAEVCPACEARHRAEAEVLRQVPEAVEAHFPGVPVRTLPELPDEPRGPEALAEVASASPSRGEASLPSSTPARRGGADLSPAVRSTRGGADLVSARAEATEAAEPREPLADSPAPAWPEALAPPGLRLLLFGGKGGVGKTTCAAAAALLAARSRPERSVALLSTDPAHSLADVLGTPLEDAPRTVPGAPPNLRARELDAPGRFAARRERYREALEHAFDGLLRRGGSSGLDAPLDREVFERLLDATPPGLDELVALLEITQLTGLVTGGEEPETPSAGGADPLLVVDTAPTGHAVRLLELPEIALRWDHALLSLLLEYRKVVGLPADWAEELLELSRGLKRLRALLADPERCRFAVVTRAGELPRRETGRLLEALEDLEVTPGALVWNAVPAGRCRACRRAAGRTRREMADLQGPEGGRGPGWTILAAPAQYPPPRGVRALERWAHRWSTPA